MNSVLDQLRIKVDYGRVAKPGMFAAANIRNYYYMPRCLAAGYRMGGCPAQWDLNQAIREYGQRI